MLTSCWCLRKSQASCWETLFGKQQTDTAICKMIVINKTCEVSQPPHCWAGITSVSHLDCDLFCQCDCEWALLTGGVELVSRGQLRERSGSKFILNIKLHFCSVWTWLLARFPSSPVKCLNSHGALLLSCSFLCLQPLERMDCFILGTPFSTRCNTLLLPPSFHICRPLFFIFLFPSTLSFIHPSDPLSH